MRTEKEIYNHIYKNGFDYKIKDKRVKTEISRQIYLLLKYFKINNLQDDILFAWCGRYTKDAETVAELINAPIVLFAGTMRKVMWLNDPNEIDDYVNVEFVDMEDIEFSFEGDRKLSVFKMKSGAEPYNILLNMDKKAAFELQYKLTYHMLEIQNIAIDNETIAATREYNEKLNAKKRKKKEEEKKREQERKEKDPQVVSEALDKLNSMTKVKLNTKPKSSERINGMKTAEEITDYVINNGYGQGSFGTRVSILTHAKVLSQNLMKEESVLLAWMGQYRDGDNGRITSSGTTGMIFAFTNKRIIWAKNKMVGTFVKSIMISKVNDISLRTGLIGNYLVVDTLKDTFTCIVQPKIKGAAQTLYMSLCELLEDFQKESE